MRTTTRSGRLGVRSISMGCALVALSLGTSSGAEAAVLEVTPAAGETLADEATAKAKAVKGVKKVERYLLIKAKPHEVIGVAALAVTILSLGYDMTQPLLAGIVTALGGRRVGQAMGLNVFTIFIGSGIGSLVFGEALRWGFPPALAIFGAVELAAAIAAIALFRSERPPVPTAATVS